MPTRWPASTFSPSPSEMIFRVVFSAEYGVGTSTFGASPNLPETLMASMSVVVALDVPASPPEEALEQPETTAAAATRTAPARRRALRESTFDLCRGNGTPNTLGIFLLGVPGTHPTRHMLWISRSTRSSTDRNGSLHRTVRCAWSFSFRCTQSTVKSRRRSWARRTKSPRSLARVVCGGTDVARTPRCRPRPVPPGPFFS